MESMLPQTRQPLSSDMPLLIMGLEASVFFVSFFWLFRAFSHRLTRDDFVSKWNISIKTGLDISCKTVSAIFAILASSLGIYLMVSQAKSGYKGPEPHPLLEHILLFAIGYFLYDLYAMFIVFVGAAKSSPSYNPVQSCLQFVKAQPLLVIHHLAIGAVLTPLMMTCLDHDPGDLMIACALIFEASTPFVSLRAILAHLDQRNSLLYMINGLLMVVVFFTCRILVFPCFYFAYSRQRNISFWAAIMKSPRMCSFFQLIVLLPQIYWLNMMIKGAMKVVQEHSQSSSNSVQKQD